VLHVSQDYILSRKMTPLKAVPQLSNLRQVRLAEVSLITAYAALPGHEEATWGSFSSLFGSGSWIPSTRLRLLRGA
jgi:hypothetical protein